MTKEMHVFDDERGDTIPAGWGVYERLCSVCGKGLVIVAPADKPPTFPLCEAHDPSPREPGLVA